MWRWQRTLRRLYEELGTIQVFDRVQAYAPDPDLSDKRAYEFRQIRRAQIIAEITRQRASRPEYRNQARISSAVLLQCAVGYAMLCARKWSPVAKQARQAKH